MAYPVNPTNPNPAYPNAASAYPNYSGIFIPEIWSTKIVEKYYDGTVLNQVTNTDYEGEIRGQGDKVIIRTTPTVQINPYQIGDPLQTQFPTGGTIELLIDKGLYWQTGIDDVVAKQQDINQVDKWSMDASEQLKIALDTEVLAYMAGQAHAQNQGATAGRISGNINLGTTAAPVSIATPNDALKLVVEIGQVLNEQNVPGTGRFIIAPPGFITLLKLSDLKAANIMGDSKSVLRTGLIGTIDRFTVYESNLLPQPGGADLWDGVLLAGHSDGTTFAMQLTNTETLRSERTFGDIMRGLVVYGYKAIKPEALAVAYYA